MLGDITTGIVLIIICSTIIIKLITAQVRSEMQKELKERDDQITAIFRILVGAGILKIEKNEKDETSKEYIN